MKWYSMQKPGPDSTPIILGSLYAFEGVFDDPVDTMTTVNKKITCHRGHRQ